MRSVWSSFCGASPTNASTSRVIASASWRALADGFAVRMSSRRGFSNSSPAAFRSVAPARLFDQVGDEVRTRGDADDPAARAGDRQPYPDRIN